MGQVTGALKQLLINRGEGDKFEVSVVWGEEALVQLVAAGSQLPTEVAHVQRNTSIRWNEANLLVMNTSVSELLALAKRAS